MNQEDINKTSILYGLKANIDKALNIFLLNIELGVDKFTINKEESEYMVSLLLFDSILSDEIGYSCLDDITFNNYEISFKNIKQLENKIVFMKDYIEYRSIIPKDLGRA